MTASRRTQGPPDRWTDPTTEEWLLLSDDAEWRREGAALARLGCEHGLLLLAVLALLLGGVADGLRTREGALALGLCGVALVTGWVAGR